MAQNGLNFSEPFRKDFPPLVLLTPLPRCALERTESVNQGETRMSTRAPSPPAPGSPQRTRPAPNRPSGPILTEDVLQRFQQRAPGYDQENRFFTEDFEELKEAGYLLMAVPREMGGLGMTMTEVCKEQRRLGYYAPADALAVNMHLISPELLYAQQEERAILFKLLIGASALASIVGFFTAWRAFHKQLRLAEMKSNFVSSVSHELRAPIASVRLMAEGLERGKISEPAKQQEYFRFITQECRRLSSMIENVLDFARIEQGRKQYEFEPTDVAALVEKTVSLMEPYAAERGVRLALSMPPASCRADESDQAETRPEGGGTFAATIDGQAVQQALVNLIDNAVKHSPAGNEIMVQLVLNPQLSTLNLSVADHGPGIPSSEHEKIFERFYRLGSELRRETPGVGIGLSIVKHVVEAHGGHVRVESQLGEGSRFTIELPMNHQDTKAPKE